MIFQLYNGVKEMCTQQELYLELEVLVSSGLVVVTVWVLGSEPAPGQPRSPWEQMMLCGLLYCLAMTLGRLDIVDAF